MENQISYEFHFQIKGMQSPILTDVVKIEAFRYPVLLFLSPSLFPINFNFYADLFSEFSSIDNIEFWMFLCWKGHSYIV